MIALLIAGGFSLVPLAVEAANAQSSGAQSAGTPRRR